MGVHTVGQIATTFTTPALAAGAAAAVAIPIAIHLLSRLRRRREPWGAMQFLLAAYRKHRRRLRLEQMLLLAVRCLAVLLLGLALSGPIVSGLSTALGAFDSGGRTVHVVIDDGLTSLATGLEADTRFERLRSTALGLLEAVGPTDRVSVWRGSRPAEPVGGEAGRDRDAARRAIEQLSPRPTRSRWPDALSEVARSVERSPSDRHTVVLLSDLARGGQVSEPSGAPAADLSPLAEGAELWLTRPADPADNVQVAELTPRRRVTVRPRGQSAVLSTDVRVRRFEASPSPVSAVIELALLDRDGRVIASRTQPFEFPAGQDALAVSMDLPVPPAGEAPDTADRDLIVRARLVDRAASDALAVDDARYTIVRIRDRLRVVLIDDGRAEASGDGGWSAGRWVTFALSPWDDGSIEVRTRAPSELSSAAVEDADAVFVLAPQAVGERGWSDLAEAVSERGLIAWVVAPPLASAAWLETMSRHLPVGARAAMEPITVAASDGEAGRELEATARPPAALGLLGADWESLLRPIRVRRYLPLEAPAEQLWLRLASAEGVGDGADPGVGRGVLVAERQGRGTVLLLGVAIDPSWTNLATKPLFVPLLHETLRALIGGGDSDQETVAGDRPMLGMAWRDAEALRPVVWSEGDAAREREREPIALRRVEGGVEAARALERVGVYTGTAGPGRLLAVNVEPDGADTRALDEAEVARWFDALGTWSYLDERDPGAALRVEPKRLAIGWPLLWVALGLLVIETVLARVLSHAYATGSPGLSGLVLRRLSRVRPGAAPRTETSGRAA